MILEFDQILEDQKTKNELCISAKTLQMIQQIKKK